MNKIGRIHADYLDPDTHLWGSEQDNPKCEINQVSNPHTLALALMDELETDSLYGVYHSVYKGTECGPTVGFQVRYVIERDNGESGPSGVCDEEVIRWIYCDDLAQPLAETPYTLTKQWMNPDESPDACVSVLAISISSIVEGVDECTGTYIIDSDSDCTTKAFWNAVEYVNKEVNEIWNDTHGCNDCFEYPEFELHPIDPDCKTCNGKGTII